MGASQSVTWQVGASSPSGSGEKVVLSDPVDGADAEQFWKVLLEQMHNKPLGNFEKSYDAKDNADGTILMVTTFDASLLLGAGAELKQFCVAHPNLANDEIVTYNYGTDEKLRDENKQFTNKLKVYRDPFVIEWYSEEHSVRRAGPFILSGLLGMMKLLGTEAKAHMDVESICEPSKLAVVSDPIEDCAVTADTCIDFLIEQAVANGGVVQPDGGIVEENSKFLGLMVTYRKHVPDKSNDQIVTTEYGGDATMTEVTGETFIKVHRNPFRLEMWSQVQGGVRANEASKKVVEAIVQAIFKKLSEG